MRGGVNLKGQYYNTLIYLSTTQFWCVHICSDTKAFSAWTWRKAGSLLRNYFTKLPIYHMPAIHKRITLCYSVSSDMPTILRCPHPTAGAMRLIEFQGNHYRANGELITCFSWRFEISTEIVIQYNPYKLSPTVWSLQRHETNQRIKQPNESSSQGSVIKQRWINPPPHNPKPPNQGTGAER